jgi:uncharacterized protein YciI
MKYWNYLLVLRPTRPAMLSEGPTPEEIEAVEAHFLYAQSLVRSGKMLLAGRTHGEAGATIGIIVFHAENDEDAIAMIDQDPVIAKGVMTAEIQPFQIALFSENPHHNEQ